MTFSLTTKLTVGLLVALAPAAFWLWETRAIAENAQRQVKEVSSLSTDMSEVKTDLKWIKNSLERLERKK